MIIHNNLLRTNEVFVMTSGDMQAIYTQENSKVCQKSR